MRETHTHTYIYIYIGSISHNEWLSPRKIKRDELSSNPR